MSTAAETIPPNPNIAATNAITKNIIAHLNMLDIAIFSPPPNYFIFGFELFYFS
jgi:hypothetical protein